MTAPSQLLLDARDGITTVTLNRPKARNAFDAGLIAEVASVFHAFEGNASVRAVVLAGTGPVFCAGMDLGWMAGSEPTSETQRLRDAEQLQRMLRAIEECPCPVIGRVQGAAYGGGIGLIAACDLVVAAEDAQFALREVRVGLVPAVIAPLLLRKIGPSPVRRYGLTGEPFSAQQAKAIGLAHEVVPADQLDVTIQELTDHLRQSGPQAVRETKSLLRQLLAVPEQEQWRVTVRANARARGTAEAQEGMRAFLEKRPPAWVSPPSKKPAREQAHG